jgi:integrase
VQRFIAHELDAGKGPRTVQMAHNVLRNALGDAMRWGLVARNVASLVRAPSYRPGERRPFTLEEQRAILAAARGDRFFIVVVLAHATGLRQSELLGIRWQDLDLDARVLRPRKQLGRNGGLRDLKSEAGKRAIPLPPSVVEVLREHRRSQDKECADAVYWEDHDLVHTTNVGRPVGQRNAHRSWTPIVRAAGVEHRGIHHMRHAYGTTLAERGVHERVAQYLLGHSDSRTTREIYTHVSDPMMDRAVEAITAAVEEANDGTDDANGSRNGSRTARKRDGSTDESGGGGR